MDSYQKKLQQYQELIQTHNIVSKTDIYGIITFVNDEFCKISGYSREELIGKNHNIVRHPDVPSSVFKKMWSIIKSKKIYKGIIKNRSKDGSAFYLSATIIPIIGEDGEIEEYIAIRHNVTDVINLNESLIKVKNELSLLNSKLEVKVKEQTKKLTKLNQSLENRIKEEIKKNEEKNHIMFQQARLVSMGDMIANIAHQWRQPLNELGICIFNLKENKDKQDEFNEIYEYCKKIIKNMSNTIDDFRNFFNKNKEKEAFFISSAINDSLVLIRQILDKSDIKLSLNLEQDCKIFGVKSEIAQVIINLLLNAKDAILKENLKKKNITISSRVGKKYAFVNVFNIGKGIDLKIMDKIFEPYFTTKHPNVGTGLGLYMSKMIIEHIGGSILVRNLKNGVSFILKFPIYKEV